MQESVNRVAPVTGLVATPVPLQVPDVPAGIVTKKTLAGKERTKHVTAGSPTRPAALHERTAGFPLLTLYCAALSESVGGIGVQEPLVSV